MNLSEEKSPILRVVTIGDTSVGKTSIITRLIQGRFNENEKTTIGAMFLLHQEKVEGATLEMQIWDTAGQEKFKSLGPIYYRGAVAAIVVFDWTCETSFTNIGEWVKAFLESCGTDASIILIGNKSDLESEYQVELEEAQRYARENGYLLFSTSAATGSGIHEAFAGIAKEIKSKLRLEKMNETNPFNLRESTNETSGASCC